MMDYVKTKTKLSIDYRKMRQVTNISIKIRLSGFNTGFDAFKTMSSLSHVPLHEGRGKVVG